MNKAQPVYWVVIQFDTSGNCLHMHCKRCGAAKLITIPTKLYVFMEAAERFVDAHRWCPQAEGDKGKASVVKPAS